VLRRNRFFALQILAFPLLSCLYFTLTTLCDCVYARPLVEFTLLEQSFVDEIVVIRIETAVVALLLVMGPCGLFSRPVQGHRMDDSPLDDVDRSILHQLQLNARQTDTEIGERVDVTSTTVRNRLDKLEGKGVIRGYHPEINYEEAGYPLHVMFVCTVNPNKLDSLADQILDIRGVVTTRELLGGERNVHVEVVAGTVREIEEIRNELADVGMTITSSEIISETQVQSWDHFYPQSGPGARQDDGTDDGSVTDQG